MLFVFLLVYVVFTEIAMNVNLDREVGGLVGVAVASLGGTGRGRTAPGDTIQVVTPE